MLNDSACKYWHCCCLHVSHLLTYWNILNVCCCSGESREDDVGGATLGATESSSWWQSIEHAAGKLGPFQRHSGNARVTSAEGRTAFCCWEAARTRSVVFAFVFYMLCLLIMLRGTEIRGLTQGLATVSQCKQEPLVVKDEVARSPGELAVGKPVKCNVFPLHCSGADGWATGRTWTSALKKLDVGLLVVTIWIDLCMSYGCSCHHHIHHLWLQ